jgi:hypothetical protein
MGDSVTFSSVERWGKRLKLWKTKPMWLRVDRHGMLTL